MQQFLSDLVSSIRTLRRSPAFTLTALVTLALGIGASTAIFSVVNSVLLRPLPYARPSELVFITSDLNKRGARDFPISPGDYHDMQTTLTQLSGVTGVFAQRIPIPNEEGKPEQVRVAFVTTNFFNVIGGTIYPGHNFEEKDGEFVARPQIPPGAAPQAPAAPPPPPAAILGFNYWRTRFNGDTKVVGTLIPFGGGRAMVVGVAPPGVELLFPPKLGVERNVDVFIAARLDYSAPRQNVLLRVIGRLKPGATIASARTELEILNNDLDTRFPLRLSSGHRERMEPLHGEITAEVRPALFALMGGVTFVLLIACANVANLILVRTARRERELAVRSALGGSRSRLVRHMLAEATALGVGGAALGVSLAVLGVKLLLAIGPANLPTIGAIDLDLRVLGFTIAASLVAVTVFGIVPALRASRPDVMSVLRASGRTSALGSAHALRNGVVIAEVALAFVLLIGSGLMLRTFAAIANVDPGFDPNGVVEFTAPVRGQSPQEADARRRQVRDRLAAIPGVTSVAASTALPFDGDGLSWAGARWGTEAAVAEPDKYRQGDVYIVVPGYFEAMRMKLVDGRFFTDEDNLGTSATVVVDDALAKLAYPGESAVGKRLSVRFRTNEAEFVTIVGVVAHSRSNSLTSVGREAYFVTVGELGAGAPRWAVRTGRDIAALAPAVRSAIAEVDPQIPISEMRPMDAALEQARAPTRFALVLISIFAGIAALLSAVGLYGVLWSVVRERTAEIGVRVALGSTRRSIFRLVIGQGLRLSVIGLALGLAAAFGLTRVIRTLLVGVSPTDPATFVAISLAFLAVAALSCWLPARRASLVDPLVALRAD